MPTKKKRVAVTLDPQIRAMIDDLRNNTSRFPGWPLSKVVQYYINEGLKVAEEEAKASTKKT